MYVRMHVRNCTHACKYACAKPCSDAVTDVQGATGNSQRARSLGVVGGTATYAMCIHTCVRCRHAHVYAYARARRCI